MIHKAFENVHGNLNCVVHYGTIRPPYGSHFLACLHDTVILYQGIFKKVVIVWVLIAFMGSRMDIKGEEVSGTISLQIEEISKCAKNKKQDVVTVAQL